MRTACSLHKENKDGGHGTNQSIQMQFKKLFLAFRSMDGHVTQYEKEKFAIFFLNEKKSYLQ